MSIPGNELNEMDFIYAMADWLGHGFDQADRCIFCSQTVTSLARDRNLEACGTDSAGQHLARAFSLPHQGKGQPA